jgi:multidrug resistance efflux pump
MPVVRRPARTEQTYRSESRHSRRRQRLHSFLRGVRTTVVVLLLIALAVAGGAYLLRQRTMADTYVKLGDAVLTAQPVPVGTTAAGEVSNVQVTPQAEVAAGQELARVRVTAANGRPETQILRSPIAGIVSEVNVPSGGVASPGQPVVTLYDPAQLTFQADASVGELRRFRLGMDTRITAGGLDDSILARLDRVVPRIGDDKADGNGFTVVFVPKEGQGDKVRVLVPGLPFTATVDTKTAVDGPPAVRSGQ